MAEPTVLPVNVDPGEAGDVTGFFDALLPRREQTISSTRIPAARVYEFVPTGPNFVRSYETQTGIPISAANALLRDQRFGSPFTFRIVPPDLLLDALLADTGADQNNVEIISAAQASSTDFRAYTAKIDALRRSDNLVQNRTQFNTIQSFLSEGRIINSRNQNDPSNLFPAQVDVRHIADVILQLTKIVETPPLTLLVNPQSMTINHQKKQNYSERSRFNYIFQSWGEEQVRISVSGVIGGFVAGDPPTQLFVQRGSTAKQIVQTAAPTGLQWATRRDSAAWQNLMNLYLMYRNNGYIYDTLERSEAHYWIGSIAIDYDQWTYVGNFESFNFGFSEEKQNGMIEFNFEFTANRIFDNATRSFVVLPIQSPSPSPSDTQWSLPTRNRNQSFFTPLAFNVNRSNRPTATSEGVESAQLPPSSVNSQASASQFGRRSQRRQGLVRGGEF